MTCIQSEGETLQQLTLATFAATLLEDVMSRSGTTAIQAGEFLGRFTITIGPTKFSGKTPREAFTKLYVHLLTSHSPYTKEQLELFARQAQEHEENETRELIDKLTEGGMTEHGKAVEAERRRLAEAESPPTAA